MAQFAGNAHWAEPSSLFAVRYGGARPTHRARTPIGRFPGSKAKESGDERSRLHQEVGRWAFEAAHFIAYVSNFPFFFLAFETCGGIRRFVINRGVVLQSFYILLLYECIIMFILYQCSLILFNIFIPHLRSSLAYLLQMSCFCRRLGWLMSCWPLLYLQDYFTC